MKKAFCLSLASFFSIIIIASAQVNTEDIKAYAGNSNFGAETLRQSSSFADAQFLKEGGLSAGLAYADYDVEDESDRLFEGDVETNSASVAYIHRLDGFNLGLVVTAVDAETDFTGTDANFASLESEADGILVTLGASKKLEKWSFILKGTVGELDVDSDRETVLGINTSNYDLTIYQVELTALYELYQSEKYALNPFAKLGYASFENDSFTESGPLPNDNVTVNDFEDEQPYVEIGLSAELYSLGAFVPSANISIWQDLGDDEIDLDGTILSTNAPFSIETPDAAETVVKADVGFAWALTESFNLGASVGYFAGDELDGINAGITGNYSF